MDVKGKLEKFDFDYVIPEEALDDWELLEVITDIDNGETQKVTTAFKLLLGEKQLKELKSKVREKCGRVSASEMMAAFSFIMSNTNETKK